MAYNPRQTPNYDEIHIEPILAVLQAWLDQHASENNPQQQLADLIFPYSEARDGGERRLRALMKQQFIEFDLAERILLRLGLGFEATPELSRIYREFNLKTLDLFKPTCPAVKEQNIKYVLSLKDEHGTWYQASQAIGTSPGQLKKFVEKFSLTEAA